MQHCPSTPPSSALCVCSASPAVGTRGAQGCPASLLTTPQGLSRGLVLVTGKSGMGGPGARSAGEGQTVPAPTRP